MYDSALAQDEFVFLSSKKRVNDERIQKEKTRIKNDFKEVDPLFFLTIDSIYTYAGSSKFNLAQQVKYQSRITSYLSKLSNPELLKNGLYNDHLLFSKNIIEADLSHNTENLFKKYPSYLLKCFSLIADDTLAKEFLLNACKEIPDEVIRNLEQYYEQPYAQKVFDKASINAPEYVKRYFSANSFQRSLLYKSQNDTVKVLQEIYSKLSPNTKSYFLLDKIIRKELSLSQTDSIGKIQNAFFKNAVGIIAQENPVGLFSVTTQTKALSIDLIRQITERSSESITYRNLTELNTDQLFCLLVYGYRETTPVVLENILNLLKRKYPTKISSNLLTNISPYDLAAFLQFLDKKEKLFDIVGFLDNEKKNGILNLLSLDRETEEAPYLTKFQFPSKHLEPNFSSIPLTTPRTIDLNSSESKPSLTKAAVIDAVEKVEPIDLALPDVEKKMLQLKKNIFQSIQHIPSFIHEPYAKEILLCAAEHEPDELFKKVDAFKGKYWCKDVMEAAAINAPISLKRYLINELHPVPVILKYSTQPAVKRMFDIQKETGFYSKPYILIDEIYQDKISLSRAKEITENPLLLFRELIKIVSTGNYVGKYSVERELNYYSLRFIRNINDKMHLPEAQHFEAVENLSADELYFLMVYGREEVFTSTFNGLYTRFEKKLPEISDKYVSQFISYPRFRNFLALCAEFNKLENFLGHFTEDQRSKILITATENLANDENDFDEAIMIAEILANTNNENTLQLMQQNIKNQYQIFDSIQKKQAMAVYGILASLCKDKAVVEKKWFKRTALQFQTHALTTLPISDLVMNDKTVECMYFYDDDDGRDSYLNFVSTFKSQPDWKVEENYNYVKVYSTSGKNIEIYANKPAYEESGEQAIAKIIKEKNYQVNVVIHRGHSFHTEKTLEKIPATAKLVFIGSCGGFYKISAALKGSPDAHIVATKQIGVKNINDPMILAFNEYIRKGKDLNWNIYWEEMKNKLGGNSLFYDYVPPHKNLESLFIRAYYQLLGV